jgi:diguanylate cyclase (GGDEF)-like protein
VYSARDVSERVAAQRALRAQARTDVLTGLANRREFEERLGRALARNLRSGGRLALLAMDLDRFKGINDQLGHAAGDTALCEFARRIESSVRGHDLVARLGGDEFVVLMEDIAEAGEAEAAGLRLLEVMREPMLLAGQHREVGTSIGLALCHGAHGATELMAAADAALYRAKAAGRGRIEISTLD